MCRTVHALISTVICAIQMVVRIIMTVLLMLENLIRMIMQTLYNFISFMMQLLSLIPICLVFFCTAKLKCLFCTGGGGPCPTNRGGGICDCLMSLLALIVLFFIFRATGVLDKIFHKIGYEPAKKPENAAKLAASLDETETSEEDTNFTSTETEIEESTYPTISDKFFKRIRRNDTERVNKTYTTLLYLLV